MRFNNWLEEQFINLHNTNMNYQQLAQIIKIKKEFLMDGKANVKSTVAQDMGIGTRDKQMDPDITEVSQEFVIPSPKKDERQDDFISRCIGAISKEYDKPGVAAAICYGKWKDKGK